jgi:hypothetical protein
MGKTLLFVEVGSILLGKASLGHIMAMCTAWAVRLSNKLLAVRTGCSKLHRALPID